MGIYDREYYRGETHGSGWLSGVAPACKAIIVINIVAFFAKGFFAPDRSTGAEFVQLWFEASDAGIFGHGRVWQLLTATFLHDGPFHLLFNMLFLWVVGREMEAMYGKRDFVAMYLSAAVISTLGWAVMAHASHVPAYMLGASGAVWAVVVLYALYYPHREVLVFFLVPMEMWVLVLLFLGIDAWQLYQGTAGHTAVASHLTGAAYGFIFKQFDLRWSRLRLGRMRPPRLRLIVPEPRETPAPRANPGPTWSPNPASASKPTSTAVLPEEQLDAKLDEVLSKIAREGRAGLTEEENRVLEEASRRARNRRSDRL